MISVVEFLSAEFISFDGFIVLGFLDLLFSDELLIDTSNFFSFTGEEGEAAFVRFVFFICDKFYFERFEFGVCWFSGLKRSVGG